jgi:integrase
VTLRAALKWAAQEKWIEVAPYVPGPTTPEPRSRWLSRDEFDRLLEAARAPHVRLFILLALHTGGRSGAILGLTWERIDLARRRIDLGSGKGNKGRASVPVNSDLHAALLEARKGATCPWVIEHGGKPVASIKTGFRAACARAGLAGRVTPHTLRHTAATWMAEDGIPMIQIARYLGHTTETTTTRVYAKFSPDYLRTAADSLVRRGS